MSGMNMREFRSDTMTLPTEEMRDAMRRAELGDDVCGEDPTVNRLQEMAADLLDKEAALFVPSGTCGNQCAIGTHVRPGDEILLSETVHIIDHEVGAAAALWGAQTRPVKPTRATYLTRDEVESRLRLVEDVHEPKTGLICLENALADGTVMPFEEMRAVGELAARHGIPMHLDGARIFNAALALGREVRDIARPADSLTFCLSKGLGAPVGSVLCGTREFIETARRKRKMLGGGMRQAGVLAAAGILAITDGVERLREDHDNARLLARLLADVDGLEVDPEQVHINLVFCRVRHPEKSDRDLTEHLLAAGFSVYPPAYYGQRFVTSSRVTERDVRDFAAAVSSYMRA